jgi:hypothetical protein
MLNSCLILRQCIGTGERLELNVTILTFNTQALALGQEYLQRVLQTEADCICLQRVPGHFKLARAGYSVYRQAQFQHSEL